MKALIELMTFHNVRNRYTMRNQDDIPFTNIWGMRFALATHTDPCMMYDTIVQPPVEMDEPPIREVCAGPDGPT